MFKDGIRVSISENSQSTKHTTIEINEILFYWNISFILNPYSIPN